MLRLFHSTAGLSYSALMQVYQQSVIAAGRQDYPMLSATEQIIQAENDLFAYLKIMFQSDPKALCAVWQEDGVYKAALRLEAYRDGMLLNSLETSPGDRRQGYAFKLIRSVLQHLSHEIIYAHIDKSNFASIALHEKCGFTKVMEHAVLLDGSVVYHDYTFCHLSR